jgi:hypothetical protein
MLADWTFNEDVDWVEGQKIAWSQCINEWANLTGREKRVVLCQSSTLVVGLTASGRKFDGSRVVQKDQKIHVDVLHYSR